jgi:hypothetical protein
LTEHKYYDRKWRVTINALNGRQFILTSEDGTEPLKVQFRVDNYMLKDGFWALLTMYNLNPETEGVMLTQGAEVTIEAGYQHQPYGRIFKGQVFQPTIDRENVVDFKVTLNCRDGLGVMEQNFVNFAVAAGYDYRSVIAKMAASAHKGFEVGYVSDSVSDKTFPAGKVFFGDADDYMNRIAEDSGVFHYFSGGKWNLVGVDDAPTAADAVVIGPENGLIGTPQQTEFGVSFRCLMNPSIAITAPMTVVKIDESVIIKQMKITPGVKPPAVLARDGQYKIVGVSYIGDSRGNDWYCDVTGINLSGKVSQLFGYFPR